MILQKPLMSCICMLVVVLGIGHGSALGVVQMQYWESTPTVTLEEAITATITDPPTVTQTLLFMDFPGFIPDKGNYVAKYTGWIAAPVTGDYVFYIASSNDSAFWLSILGDPNDSPECSVVDFSSYRSFTEQPNQESSPITLQAGQAYGFTIIQRAGSGAADYASLGWTLPGEETIEVVGSQYFTNEFKTGGSVPEVGAVDVKSGLLSWLPPAASSGDALNYDIYLGTDPNQISLEASGVDDTSYDVGDVGVSLAFDQVYYWRVDVRDPNIGGTPMTYTGDLWSFTTNDGNPFFVATPENVFGQLNDDAVFTVVADSLHPGVMLSYQWSFRSFGEQTWTDIEGATSETLLIEGLQPKDRGIYRITVTDSLGNFIAAEAYLHMRVGLVHRYSFTDSLEDSVGGADATLIVQDPVTYPAVFEDATGTSGDSTKRQLFLNNTGETTSPPRSDEDLCYVELPAGMISSLGDQMTVMVWFTWKEPRDGTWRGLFAFNDGDNGDWLTLAPRGDSRTPRFAYRQYGQGPSIQYVFSTTTLPLTNRSTTEHFIAITWNEDTEEVEMYYNGEHVGTGPILGDLKLEDQEDYFNWLGRPSVDADRAFYGSYNEFRIYNAALSPATIMNAYQLGPDVLPDNPCVFQPEFDLNDDCVVNIYDLASLGSEWLACGLTTCN